MTRRKGSTNTGYSLERRERKDGGKPRWRVRLWIEDPATGESKLVTVGIFELKTEAQAKGREAVYKRDNGTLLDKTNLTLSQLIEEWFESKENQVEPNTFRDYQDAFRKHIKPAMGARKVQTLRASDFARQYMSWIALDNPNPISRRSVHRCDTVLRQALSYAVVVLGVLQSNPLEHVRKPKLEKTQMNVWSVEEVRRFLDLSLNCPVQYRQSLKLDATVIDYGTRVDELSPLWHFLAAQGMRRGEALGLRWKDVNWDRGTVHVYQTVIADKSSGGAAKIQPSTKTATGARSVRLTRNTIDALKAHRISQNARRLACSDWEDNDLIICTSKGKPITPANVTRSFERLVRLGSLPRIRVHDLRHTVATILLGAGVPVKVVSEQLGHANVGITLDTYSHVLPDMQDSAAEILSDLLEQKKTA